MKVLIIRLGAMGDVCMAVPVVAALQQHCEVHWLVRKAYAGIPRLFPSVLCRLIPVAPRVRFSDAVVSRLRHERYDAVLDFSHWPMVADLVRRLPDIPIRAITHDPEQDALLGIKTHGLDLGATYKQLVPAPPGQHQVEKWGALLHESLGMDVPLRWPLPDSRVPGVPLRVFIHPHASKPEKRWPAHRFAEVVIELSRQQPVECAINSGARKELPAALGLWLRLRAAGVRARIAWLDRGYQRLRVALEQADVALGCDSGPMHLAALLGVPTLVIYGPYPHTEFGPLWRSVPVAPPRRGQHASRVTGSRVRLAMQSLLGGLTSPMRLSA